MNVAVMEKAFACFEAHHWASECCQSEVAPPYRAHGSRWPCR